MSIQIKSKNPDASVGMLQYSGSYSRIIHYIGCLPQIEKLHFEEIKNLDNRAWFKSV